MIILHAGWLDRTLRFWAEVSPGDDWEPPSPRGRKPQKPRPAPHPFAVSSAVLGKVLADLAGGRPEGKRGGRKRQAETVCAWLPTRGRTPLPSSPVIFTPSRSRAAVSLRPWLVPSRVLPAETACGLLAGCEGKTVLVRGVAAGGDLAWWVDAFRLAVSLAVRQAYLPGLEETGRGWEARWQPVFEGDDWDRLSALAGAMPPSARCLSRKENEGPPGEPAVAAATGFIALVLDHLARSAGAGRDERAVDPAAAGTETPAKSTSGRRRTRSTRFDSVHDAWMHALVSEDALIAWDDRIRLAETAEQMARWQGPMLLTAHAAHRLCFRLEEGLSDAGEAAGGEAKDDPPRQRDWYLRFLLQSREDPSLLVALEKLWQPRGRGAPARRELLSEAREYLLAALGQAAVLCPAVAAGLERAEPAGCRLDTREAHEFLVLYGPSLKAAGFGVLLPAWWTGKGTRVHLRARARVKSPSMKSKGTLTLDTVAEVNWELALGDTVISPAELRELATLKAPLVNVRGEWVEIDHHAVEQAAKFLSGRAPTGLAAGEALRLALGSRPVIAGVPVEEVKVDGWIGRLLEEMEGDGAFCEQPVPIGFHGTLRPYQVRGYSWLCFLRRWGLGACLADDMGLGKTVQALALIQRDRESKERRPVLVVCPTTVVGNWHREAARFTPDLPVLVHHGAARSRGKAFKKEARQAAVVITSYGHLRRDLELLQKVTWSGVILDEAQNIKNPETRQSRAARSLSAGYRLALTGTPVENHVGDIWPIMEFLNPGLLGSQASFKNRFFRAIQLERDERAAAALKRLTGPFILRRLKTDRSIIDDLPEKMEMKTYCNLTKEQATLYAAVLDEVERILRSAEGMQRRGLILATLIKLKQICNHPAQFLRDGSVRDSRSGKLARLVEMLEELLESGEKALIFTQFREMGAILHRYLEDVFGRECLFLHGGTPRGARDQMVKRFQHAGAGSPPFFILSLKAGGTGLNLTGAGYVFHFDRWWNPAVENQATDRAFRIGQTRNVQVYKFVCAGTLEERIDEMIERKTAVAEQIIGSGEGWLTELGNEELRAVLALGGEAVGD